MKLTTTLERFEDNLWGYHLPIKTEIAEQFIEGDNRRICCTINNDFTLHCALMPLQGGYFILMNKPNVKKLGLRVGEKVELTIEKDRSTYGLPMPESFEALLEQDEKGSKYFHNLTPGKQRSLIYIVSKVKNIDSQLNKGMAILKHLKDTHGKIESKMLMETIKHYNQRSRLK